MFYNLEAKGRNRIDELPTVLWSLRTNPNSSTRVTPLHLVYRAYVVLPPEIRLRSPRVEHFDDVNQSEARELDVNLLDEARDAMFTHV